MTPLITSQKIKLTTWSGLLGFFVISCGSYDQASYYDNDGIYSTSVPRTESVVVRETPQPQTRTQPSDDGFYQNYFGEKSQELDEYMNGEVFTDADSYSSTSEIDSLRLEEGNYIQNYNNDYGGQPGWGDSGTNVSINLYGGGGWGVGYGWGWGYAGYGWGYPGYGWGWGYPGYGWGWGYPGYGYGWGWGYPGYGWGYPGYGWGYPG
ncbi:MAG: hypothetical protein WBN54_07990, partial [Robiginitalea sp.]